MQDFGNLQYYYECINFLHCGIREDLIYGVLPKKGLCSKDEYVTQSCSGGIHDLTL